MEFIQTNLIFNLGEKKPFMNFAVKCSAPTTFAALLLLLSIFSTSLPVSAQIYREDNAVSEGLEVVQAPPDDADEEGILQRDGDNFKSPLAAEQFKRRQEALRQKIAGKKSGKVHQVAKGQYVELELERNDRVFVILVEYGNSVSTNPNVPTFQGPLHNQIAEPNRLIDNSTIWQADYNREHFVDMYFNQMVNYYQSQSSGRYTINGAVTEWVKVPFNGARYGNNGLGDAAAWTLIADAINIWTNQQLAAGKTLEEVTDYLKTFDLWDRYDYNNNGNFDEPDGYIDHFQIVHSGAGEETGGGAQGADAIWSHRWFAWNNRGGIDGPAYNRDGGVEFGGGVGANPTGAATSSTTIGTTNPSTAPNVNYAHPVNRTGIWVGDYTIQPENGGLGVFAHEYGHDLGLPDHYDTNGGDNATGFWTLMSSGSYLGDGTKDIGAGPGDMGAWEKIQLGWSNFDVASTGVYSEHKLGPAETNTKKAQALVVSLPADQNDLFLYDPAVGSLQYGTYAWWGGKVDSADHTMIRQVSVPAGTSTLNMRLKYQMETNWDYAYVSVSTNGGTSWTNLAGTYLNAAGNQAALTTNTNANGQNLGNGITGSSGNTATNAPLGWRLAAFNLTPYANQTVLLRLRYKTDPDVTLNGFLADEISLNGTLIDNAENGANGWTINGFKASNGLEKTPAPHYYIAEYRQYRTYDKGLETGPYVFGSFAPREDWVEHFPYQDGLLITYWDTTQGNNNTSQHSGEGRVLPIDAHPEPLRRRQLPMGGGLWNFSPWRNRVQSYDSTFGLEPTDPIRLPFVGTISGAVTDPSCAAPVTTGTPPNQTTTTACQFWTEFPSLPANREFNDLNIYWYAENATGSVIVPKTGTTIRVINTSAQGTMMKLEVNSALAPVTQ